MLNWVDKLSNFTESLIQSNNQSCLGTNMYFPGKWEMNQAQDLASTLHTESSYFSNSLKPCICANVSLASFPSLSFIKTVITQSYSSAQGSF